MGWSLFRTGNTKLDDKITRDYREVFDTPKGRRVFAHMVTELGLFDSGSELTEADRARQDYAKRLMDLTGVWRAEKVVGIIETWFKLPVRYEEDDG